MNTKELEPFKEYVTPQMATSITASIISFIIIMILNNLYEKVAIWITDFGKWPPFIYESFWSLCSGKVCEIKYLISGL